MSITVRNALVFAGVVTLAIALLILAWRIARWLLIGVVWLVALTVVGVVLLTKLVALQAPLVRAPSRASCSGDKCRFQGVIVRRLGQVATNAPRYAQELSWVIGTKGKQ